MISLVAKYKLWQREQCFSHAPQTKNVAARIHLLPRDDDTQKDLCHTVIYLLGIGTEASRKTVTRLSRSLQTEGLPAINSPQMLREQTAHFLHISLPSTVEAAAAEVA